MPLFVLDIARIIITFLFLLKIGCSSMFFVLLEFSLQYVFIEAQIVFQSISQRDYMTTPLQTSFLFTF